MLTRISSRDSAIIADTGQVLLCCGIRLDAGGRAQRPGARPAWADEELRTSAVRQAGPANCRCHSEPVMPDDFSVHERDDDDEADHDKGDHIAIKSIEVFSVEVETHRAILLFGKLL
jgi:hypothetical protein